ncbi:MAG: energy-coupling factor transporter ATPase, partial [Lachnospiraceae bacterium]|nr:energy-coupling factor transporter ATPase [Lachnospiraceae bacterium]
VIDHGKIRYDDKPRQVFAHYRELEAMGLAAPQVTYLMHELKEHGIDVDTNVTTIEEAKEVLLGKRM